jgi:threonine dehydrogenase-like Zn-dependent dehydrogenase
VGICGSDLHAFDGRHPFIRLPVVPGHEVAGIVDAVGPGAGGFQAGDRVLLEPNLVCGRCFYCTSGRYNLCEKLQVVGCQTAGALAEAFVAPAGRLHHVPEGMSWTAAALVEPLATATHAARVAGNLNGAAVAVLGAGSIGLLTMLSARAAGATTVVMTDLVEARRWAALELGATAAVDPADPAAAEAIRSALPHRPDVVFDCVANESTLNHAIGLAEKGGTVIVIGVPSGPARSRCRSSRTGRSAFRARRCTSAKTCSAPFSYWQTAWLTPTSWSPPNIRSSGRPKPSRRHDPAAISRFTSGWTAEAAVATGVTRRVTPRTSSKSAKACRDRIF